MRLKLSRMERLAVTAVDYRYRRDTHDAVGQRNADLLAVLEEHGVHAVPDEFTFERDEDGYVTVVAWSDETQGSDTTTHA